MPKKIVICLDGTANQFGNNNTNVLNLYSMLEKSTDQLTYYDPGVGTLAAPTARSKLSAKWSLFKGQAIGAGLFLNIEEAYRFLMENYDEGDSIYLFGFSRGAYSALAVAAMIEKCGLLDKGNENLLPYAMRVFRYERDWSRHRGFRQMFGRKIQIQFIGLWDCVKSVGRFWDFLALDFTRSNASIRNLVHAISIDEKRAHFRQHILDQEKPHQSFKQVWFPGVHADIGGGYPPPESGLSLISLEWMLKHCCELNLDQAEKNKIFTGYNRDINAPRMHDELEKFYWRILEYIPKPYKDPSDDYQIKWKAYQRSPRFIGEGAIIHQSTIDRMNAGAYVPTNLPPKFGIEPW